MDNNPVLEAYQAADLENLLEHVAWTEVLQPKLLELKEQYSIMLVSHDLGEALPGKLTREQLAGRIYGINFILKLIRDVLVRGTAATAELRASGFSIAN